MNRWLRVRLQGMMFLQFFVWGSWYVTVGNYMAAHGMSEEIFWAYAVGPIAAIFAPFLLGVIADRYLAAERLLGLLVLAGSIPIYLASTVAEGKGPLFILLLLAHTVCFFPTVGLTSTLIFHHITDRSRQFTGIRVFGTLGWMVAGVTVSYVLAADESALTLRIAAGSSVLFGLYAFTLPHTPPRDATRRLSVRAILGIDALRHMATRPFLVFLLSIFLLSIPLSSYYAYAPIFLNAAGLAHPAFKMAFGQVSEVAVMLVMPFFLIRLGVKALYTVGMTAWLLRFILFGFAAPESAGWLILTGVLLHGICFNFTFVAGLLYTDQQATPEIRGQAQGLMVMVNNGFGLVTGALISGALFNGLVGDQLVAMGRWQLFWAVPGAVVVLVFILFQVLFNPAPHATTGAS